MPFLPLEFYSDYYLVEIDFQDLFNYLQIPNTPVVSGKARFLASKFELTYSGQMGKQSYVQGKPGTLVQDSPTPYYVYKIEAPMIINGYVYPGSTNFLPYNCLNYFALWMVNWQWQMLHGYLSNQSLTPDQYYVAVKNYTITSSQANTNQSLEIWSNTLLEGSSLLRITAKTLAQTALTDYAAYLDVAGFLGRVVKNYDIYANTLITPVYADGVGSPYLLNTFNTNIFLESATVNIDFKIDPKYFLNTGSSVVFALIDYDLQQQYGIVGFEQNTLTANFQPGLFGYYYATNNLTFGDNNQTLIEYQAPMLIKSKSNILSANQLTKTNLDMSLYGVSYSPGNSPYDSLYFCRSSLS